MSKMHALTSIFSLLLIFGSTSHALSNDAKDSELVSKSNGFPHLKQAAAPGTPYGPTAPKEAKEFMQIDYLLTQYDSCEEMMSKELWTDNAVCSYYVESGTTTRAALVTADQPPFLGILFAGINGLEDIIFDADLTLVPFGPHGTPLIEGIKVHAGYNDLLFYYGLFDDLLTRVTDYLEKNPSTQVYTSGHSLGGALAQLMAVGISHSIPDQAIKVITTGTPVVGDKGWANWVNNNANVNIWSFVYDGDIVPRLQISDSWAHVGNTYQLNKHDVKLYYQHYGDSSLGYAGVPPTWRVRALYNPVKGVAQHLSLNYINYLQFKSIPHNKTFYTYEFVNCTKITCPKDYDDATF